MKYCTIKDFPDYILYEDGRVYSQPRQGTTGGLLNHKYHNGYPSVLLRKPGRSKRYGIHRLLGEHFIPRVEGKNLVCHKDDNKDNYSLDNLYWGDYSDNNADQWDNKRGRSRKIFTFMTDWGVSVTTDNLTEWCEKYQQPKIRVQQRIFLGRVVYLKKYGKLLKNNTVVDDSKIESI
jgi:hypothetical protein